MKLEAPPVAIPSVELRAGERITFSLRDLADSLGGTWLVVECRNEQVYVSTMLSPECVGDIDVAAVMIRGELDDAIKAVKAAGVAP